MSKDEIWELQGNLSGAVDALNTKIDALTLRISKLEEIVFRRKEIEDFRAQKSTQVQDVTISMFKLYDENLTFSARVDSISPEKTGKTKEDKEWRNISIALSDHTGKIRLTLWNDDVDTYKFLQAGDTIKVKNAYVTEYKDKLQLRIGKSGSIEVPEEHIL